MEIANITLITTVKNEGKSIKELLDSILNQSLLPKEYIIVDGGSIDNTVEIIKKYIKQFRKKGVKLKIIVAKGANIAKGRNIAIEKASCNLIASIDAGCKADKNWLKELYNTYKKSKADVIVGTYLPTFRNDWEKAFGIAISLPVEFWDENEVPSSRSVMFTKKAWKAVNGYPEYLYTAEDATFNYKLKEKSFKFKLARKAIVYWKMRKSLKKFFKQFFNYGYGDGRVLMALKFFKQPKNDDCRSSFFVIFGGYFIILLLILTFLISPLMFPIVLLLPIVYLLSSSIRRIKLWKESLKLLPKVFISLAIKRIAYFVGYHFGLCKRIKDMIRCKKNDQRNS